MIKELCLCAITLIPIKVVKVIDGDTYKVLNNGKTNTLRLARTDTAETSKRNKAYKDAYITRTTIDYQILLGKYTKNVVTKAILGRRLWYYPDIISNKDKYNRLMAWVFISSNISDGVCLNINLIKNGLARATYTNMPIPKAISTTCLSNEWNEILSIKPKKHLPRYRIYTLKDIINNLMELIQ